MKKIVIELQIDWEGYEGVSDELIIEDAIEPKVKGVGWTLLRQPPVSDSLDALESFVSDYEKVKGGQTVYIEDSCGGSEPYYSWTVIKAWFESNRIMPWVLLNETKPDPLGQWLLVYAKTGRHIAWYNGSQFEDRAEYVIDGVTHWMQIPEPPSK